MQEFSSGQQILYKRSSCAEKNSVMGLLQPDHPTKQILAASITNIVGSKQANRSTSAPASNQI
jgi:hypothetical protein